MAKRSVCSTSWKNSSTKKAKVDELSDFWEDDLDEDAIDDCFRKATQETCADVSLLSSYSVFKQPQHLLTSTQYSQPPVGGRVNTEIQIREWEDKYAQKEGEASILRSNLQNLRTSCQVDQERKDLEWKEKLSSVEKENKTIKSDLEFKNLEIVNLKQQITELSRLVNVEQNITQKLRTTDNYSKVLPNSPEKSMNSSCSGNARIYVNLEKYYPLKSFNSSFTPKEFSKVLQNVNYKKSINKQKNTFSNDITVESVMNSLYEEIISLVNLSSEDLNSSRYDRSVSKVVWFFYQLLKIFQNNFCEMEKDSPFHETREQDAQYLHTDRLREISLFCTELIRFLQEMLPFSTFLKNCLLMDTTTYLNSTKITRTDVFGEVVESHYLTLLSHIITTIGKTKQEKNHTSFLSTVIKLLCRIFSSEDLTHLKQSTEVNIIKQLLVLNLDFHLIQQINVLLNVVACSHNFNILFSDHEKIKNNCSKECCRFLIYISLLEDTSLKIEEETEFSCFTSSILSLTHNILKAEKTCECVSKLYKLSIGIIYKNLKVHQASRRKEACLAKNYVDVLNLIIFNAYDLTQKYIIDYAQIKEIMYTMTCINGEINNMNLKNLDKLSATEDFPLIPREKFNVLNL